MSGNQFQQRFICLISRTEGKKTTQMSDRGMATPFLRWTADNDGMCNEAHHEVLTARKRGVEAMNGQNVLLTVRQGRQTEDF